MTGIEWTDVTWNPVVGCSRVSEGCRNCYAERMDHRIRGAAGEEFREWSARNAAYNVRLHPERLEAPLHWRKPRRVFVNSMSDLFHEEVPDVFIADCFAAMVASYWHIFQVLTKRPDRQRQLLGEPAWRELVSQKAARLINPMRGRSPVVPNTSHSYVATVNLAHWEKSAARNVWLGVSVEDQRAADERIPELLATPSAVRFLSVEPLLGPVDLRFRCIDRGPGDYECCSRRASLHWVITGGESGPGSRPCDVAWLRSIVGQCKTAGVPCFVKQLGSAWVRGMQTRRRVTGDESFMRGSAKGGDPSEWPADLRVREFPEAVRA